MKLITVLTLAAAFATAPQLLAEDGSEKSTTGASKGFVKLDTNKDGFLSEEEFSAGKKNPENAAKNFKRKDTDQDGKLSPKEFDTKPAKKEGGKKKDAE